MNHKNWIGIINQNDIKKKKKETCNNHVSYIMKIKGKKKIMQLQVNDSNKNYHDVVTNERREIEIDNKYYSQVY